MYNIRGGTHPKLNRDGEPVAASLLGDLRTTGDAGKVDEGGLNETLLALDGSQELLGETGGC